MAENFFGVTDTGKLRDNNEDAFIAEKVLNETFVLACVIDGVGGYEGGEVAAAIAREAILHYFTIPSGDMITMMKEALKTANEKIYREKEQTGRNRDMACVLTLAMVNTARNKFYYAHVGDTRLYLLRDDTLVKVTKDHSFVGFLEDSGRLSEDAAMAHPKRNEINKALGFDSQFATQPDYIETGESPFLPGDMLLLCSDGLTDLVNRNAITAILTSEQSLEEKGAGLIEAANNKGGKDNITVVLVQHTKKPVKRRATRPAATVEKKKSPLEEEQTERLNPGELPEANQPKAGRKNKNKGIIFSLSLLCIFLLIACVWLWFQHSAAGKPAAASTQNQPLQETARHSPEQTGLINLLNGPATTIVLSDSVFKQAIPFTDTLFIRHDSMHLQGRGNIIFRRDSTFAGAAVVLSPNCKYVLLDNITLENFDIGVLVQGATKALHLKNVRFLNCRVPVQYQFLFPHNQYINGTLGERSLFKADTLLKK